MLALLGGTTAAFTLTEALKLQRSPIGRPRFEPFFSPVCACGKSAARLTLRLRKADRLDAVIIDADGEPVRSLASGVEHARGRVVLIWDGRTDDGALAPDGAYRLRVHLAGERRTIVVPNVVRLDTQPPAVELVSVTPRVLSPDGDGRHDLAQIELSLSERARPLILAESQRAGRARVSEAGTAEIKWGGRRAGRPLPAGVYLVAVQARDGAGNLSAPSTGVTVRIRYVELRASSYVARRGGILHFRVSADSPHFRWEITRRGRRVLAGKARTGPVAVRLPERILRGRYFLRVMVNRHVDGARLVVRPR